MSMLHKLQRSFSQVLYSTVPFAGCAVGYCENQCSILGSASVVVYKFSLLATMALLFCTNGTSPEPLIEAPRGTLDDQNFPRLNSRP